MLSKMYHLTQPQLFTICPTTDILSTPGGGQRNKIGEQSLLHESPPFS